MKQMSRQLAEIMAKRAELLARIAAQRQEVVSVGARLRTPLAIADHAVAAGRYLRAHPLLLVAAAGAVVVIAVRRRSLMAVAGSALRFWNIFSAARNYSARFVSRL